MVAEGEEEEWRQGRVGCVYPLRALGPETWFGNVPMLALNPAAVVDVEAGPAREEPELGDVLGAHEMG